MECLFFALTCGYVWHIHPGCIGLGRQTLCLLRCRRNPSIVVYCSVSTPRYNEAEAELEVKRTNERISDIGKKRIDEGTSKILFRRWYIYDPAPVGATE